MKRLTMQSLMILVAASVVSARAGTVEIVVSEGATSYVILDNGPLDTNPATNQISAVESAVIFPDYSVLGLDASTNNPGAAGGAILTVDGEVQRTTGGVASPLVIDVTDTDFALPLGALRTTYSSSTDTFTDAPPGDSHAFTSWFNPSNIPVAKEFASPTLTLTSSGPLINSQNGDTALSVSSTVPYGLTNETRITLSGTSGTTVPDVAFTGATQVLLVPEPASLVMLGIGVLGMISYAQLWSKPTVRKG
jgi:hypothetical protein